jgi:DNA-binding response OmpR family regulator
MNTPIIVISAAKDEFDKVLLLELGADDYVVKPFGARELLARIKAVLRRSNAETRMVLNFANVEVDTERRVVTSRGSEVPLTPSEYNLLTYFLRNPNRVLTREAILEDVWGFESAPTARTVDSHVVKLRQKLEPDPSVPRYFLTVHGVGYRFVG